MTRLVRSLVLLSPLLVPTVAGCDASGDDDAFRAAAEAAELALDEAIDSAEQTDAGGLAVDAHLVEDGGVPYYEVTLVRTDETQRLRVQGIEGDVEWRSPAPRGGDFDDSERALADRGNRLSDAIRGTCDRDGDILIGARISDGRLDLELIDEDGERYEVAGRELADRTVSRPSRGRGDADRGDTDRSDADRGDIDRGAGSRGDADRGDRGGGRAAMPRCRELAGDRGNREDLGDRGEADRGDSDRDDAGRGDAGRG
ncbi:MAG: hypothetical protein AAF799_34315 [Myxococcota bacterium]